MVQTLCRRYLEAVQSGDARAAAAFFAPHARVRSPLYGDAPAESFIAAFFEDTQASRAEVEAVYAAPDGAGAALRMRYAWTLANGAEADFDVVGLFRLTPERDRFAELEIVCDTAHVRAVFDEMKQAFGSGGAVAQARTAALLSAARAQAED